MSDNRLVRVQSTSKILKEEFFVDPTYFAEPKPIVFYHHFVEYQTKAGRVRRRGASGIRECESQEEMEKWIESLDASEGHPGDVPCRGWVPDEWLGATA